MVCRLPKFRLRTLLVMVALVGLVLGGEMNRRRWATYSALARHHAKLERGALWTGRQCLDNVIECSTGGDSLLRQAISGRRASVENSAPFAEEAGVSSSGWSIIPR